MTSIDSQSSPEAHITVLRGRLNGAQKNRLSRLLNMMYTPRELADELGINVRQIYRVYIPGGCPHERDSRRHIWINGVMFREWYCPVYKKRKLTKNEAFCLTCKAAIKMANKEMREKDGLSYWVCECPNCGRKLARIVNLEKPYR